MAVLLGAYLYDFSWRYQLPALVTLPVAGAFGVTALVGVVRARRQGRLAASMGSAGVAAEAAEAEVAGALVSAEIGGTGEAGGADAGGAAESADELAVAGSEQAAP